MNKYKKHTTAYFLSTTLHIPLQNHKDIFIFLYLTVGKKSKNENKKNEIPSTRIAEKTNSVR